MTAETNSKPRQSRVKKGLSKFGAGKKKKKWELRRKNMHKKTSKEAFQAWMDHVRKKRHVQQTTEMQRYVPWDPGGFIYESRSSQVPDHRSPSPSLIATSTLIEATD
jgi:hypothetical protein